MLSCLFSKLGYLSQPQTPSQVSRFTAHALGVKKHTLIGLAMCVSFERDLDRLRTTTSCLCRVSFFHAPFVTSCFLSWSVLFLLCFPSAKASCFASVYLSAFSSHPGSLCLSVCVKDLSRSFPNKFDCISQRKNRYY